MAFRRLIPLLDRVLVEKVAPAAKTTGGILLPESASKVNSAKVLAVGAGGRDNNGNLVPVSVKEGDTVLLPEYGGTQVKLADGKEYVRATRAESAPRRRACARRSPRGASACTACAASPPAQRLRP